MGTLRLCLHFSLCNFYIYFHFSVFKFFSGATQSTLQDIKVAEKAGGYYYTDPSKIHNRNRFIYWRTDRDVLELSEISLDLNLVDSNVRYKFTDSPVLAVAISEIDDNVVVLVATVSSLHHLKFSHPNRIHKSNDETQAYSVFHDSSTNKSSARDSSSLFHVIGHAAMPSMRFLFCFHL